MRHRFNVAESLGMTTLYTCVYIAIGMVAFGEWALVLDWALRNAIVLYILYRAVPLGTKKVVRVNREPYDLQLEIGCIGMLGLTAFFAYIIGKCLWYHDFAANVLRPWEIWTGLGFGLMMVLGIALPGKKVEVADAMEMG